jgi:hypothetical protein
MADGTTIIAGIPIPFTSPLFLSVVGRDFGPNIDLSSQYAAELVKGPIDVIVAYGDVAVHAAQQATKTIPIVAVTDVSSATVSSPVVIALRSLVRRY